jgi:hypothetical protein
MRRFLILLLVSTVAISPFIACRTCPPAPLQLPITIVELPAKPMLMDIDINNVLGPVIEGDILLEKDYFVYLRPVTDIEYMQNFLAMMEYANRLQVYQADLLLRITEHNKALEKKP